MVASSPLTPAAPEDRGDPSRDALEDGLLQSTNTDGDRVAGNDASRKVSTRADEEVGTPCNQAKMSNAAAS